MFEQDYILRQIQLLAQGLARIFFRKEKVEYTLPARENEYTLTDLWYRRILALVEEGKYNQAENLLFEELEPGNRAHLTAALSFYDRLSALDGDTLERGGFSVAEIRQGLEDVSRLYGIDLEEGG